MPHNTDKVGFPDAPLSEGMIIRLTALDPTTDATVAGVEATRCTARRTWTRRSRRRRTVSQAEWYPHADREWRHLVRTLTRYGPRRLGEVLRAGRRMRALPAARPGKRGR